MAWSGAGGRSAHVLLQFGGARAAAFDEQVERVSLRERVAEVQVAHHRVQRVRVQTLGRVEAHAEHSLSGPKRSQQRLEVLQTCEFEPQTLTICIQYLYCTCGMNSKYLR